MHGERDFLPQCGKYVDISSAWRDAAAPASRFAAAAAGFVVSRPHMHA
jgi:hypothetical protein